MKLHRGRVDDIPLIYVKPAVVSRHRLVIFLHGFGGTKESILSRLEELAGLGFTALGFDAWQHGERMVADARELRERVLGNIRRFFWPILRNTAHDVPRIVDWALDELDIDRVSIAGISMGGDISVAAAGIDQRISLVIPGVATPDWLRPGTNERVGSADEAAQQCYDELNPLTHIEMYAHKPTIVFQNGSDDRQVPPDGSIRFRDALRNTYYTETPGRIEVVLHPGVGHEYTEAMWENTKQLLVRAD